MPPNTASRIRRRLRQVDHNLKRAQELLADVFVTVREQHPDIAGGLLSYILFLEGIRQYHLNLYRTCWGGTERGLWREGDVQDVFANAQPLRTP